MIVLAYLAIFCVVGSVGNALAIYITAVVREPIISRHFIIALAVVDMMTCVIVLPMTSYLMYVEFNVPAGAVCRVYQFLITSNIPFSIFIMVAIAIERCVAICWPHAQPASPTLIITLLAMVSLGLGTVVALTYDTRHGVPVSFVYDFLENSTSTANQNPGESLAPCNSTECVIGSNSSSSRSFRHLTNQLATNMPRDSVTATSDTRERVWDDALRLRAAQLVDGVWVGERLYVNVGRCLPNDMLISLDVQWYFHKFYTCLYLVSFALVIVFYSLICRTVLARQRRIRSHKMTLMALDCMRQPITHPELHHVVVANTALLMSPLPAACSVTSLCENIMDRRDIAIRPKKVKIETDKATLKRRQRRLTAEIKAAGMLFVVSMVLLVTYIPALLITLDWLPYRAPIFYLYFINFAINPVIYGFMNSRFRKRLKSIFSCRRREGGHNRAVDK